jgi:hypothetical protein
VIACALQDHERDPERHERDEEVAHHDERMELEEDGDPAQDSLGENGERKRHRAPEEPAWQARDAEGRRGGHERRQADGEARDAVPELD